MKIFLAIIGVFTFMWIWWYASGGPLRSTQETDPFVRYGGSGFEYTQRPYSR